MFKLFDFLFGKKEEEFEIDDALLRARERLYNNSNNSNGNKTCCPVIKTIKLEDTTPCDNKKGN